MLSIHVTNTTKFATVTAKKILYEKLSFPILLLKVAKVGDSRRFLLSMDQYFEESA